MDYMDISLRMISVQIRLMKYGLFDHNFPDNDTINAAVEKREERESSLLVQIFMNTACKKNTYPNGGGYIVK